MEHAILNVLTQNATLMVATVTNVKLVDVLQDGRMMASVTKSVESQLVTMMGMTVLKAVLLDVLTI